VDDTRRRRADDARRWGDSSAKLRTKLPATKLVEVNVKTKLRGWEAHLRAWRGEQSGGEGDRGDVAPAAVVLRSWAVAVMHVRRYSGRGAVK
jgi:hypothetical protein